MKRLLPVFIFSLGTIASYAASASDSLPPRLVLEASLGTAVSAREGSVSVSV